MVRIRQHTAPSKMKNETYKNRWLRQVVSRGTKPLIITREYTNANVLPDEEKFWIRIARGFGCALTNTTEGGEGTVGFRHSEETKRSLSEKRKGQAPTRGFSGRAHTEESKRKTSQTLLAQQRTHTFTPEGLERLRLFQTGRKASVETKQKMSLARRGVPHPCKGHPHTEQSRKKIAEANRNRVWSEESRRKASESRRRVAAAKRESSCL